jgi:phage repressor protein C with HTH and peptisase S24 domain
VPSAITSCERTDPATRIQSQAGGTPLNWLLQSGDSMSPGVRPGDEVGYRPGLAGPLSDGLHVLLPVSTVGPATGLTPLVRRCHRRLDGLIEVACDNPLYPERERYREGASGHLTAIRAEGCDVEVVGRVIELRTRLE